MKERRERERFQAAYPIEEAESDLSTTLKMKNVSQKGIAFRAYKAFQENQKIDLKIFLKNKMFKVKADIIHSIPDKGKSFNIGAKFISPTQEFRDILLKESEDIMHLLKELNLHVNKKISFKEAAKEYLEDTHPPKNR